VQHALDRVPLAFEPNQGQTDPQVRYTARGKGLSQFLTASEAVMVLPPANSSGAERAGIPTPLDKAQNLRPEKDSSTDAPVLLPVVRMRLVGANPAAEVVGLNQLPGRSNYFLGNDSSKWQTDVPHYASVEYRNVYPGVNLEYYGTEQGEPEYDFVVAPGASPQVIQLAFQGVSEARIDGRGNLELTTPSGTLLEHAPVIYQQINGGKQPVAGKYVVQDAQHIGFAVPSYDAMLPLVIDPIFSYSTYLGGSLNDEGLAVAVDGSGNAYVTGRTASTDFPTANALYSTFRGGPTDAFVTKLSADGSTLLYSTYLGGNSGGGSGADVGYGIAVDADGNAYVTGNTQSQDFPTFHPLQDHLGRINGSNAFLTKFNARGSALLYSSYLGGTGFDVGLAVAVDSMRRAYVTGYTTSSDFPTRNPLQRNKIGFQDAFVAKLDPSQSGLLSLVYSTYYGGNSIAGNGIAVDANFDAFVTGYTGSTVLRTTPNAYQSQIRGFGTNAFLAEFNPNDSDLLYGSFFGGTGTVGAAEGDVGTGIALDVAGKAYITGSTTSSDFPTKGSPLQQTYGGGQHDAFVAKFDTTQASGPDTLVFSTYLGGNGDDIANGIAVNGDGEPYVTGVTASTNFPTLNALQPFLGNNSGLGGNAFVAKLTNAGNGLVYSTYLGGNANDEGKGIAVDADGNAYVVGQTSSTNFPTVKPLQMTNGGGNDAFITKLLEQPLVQRLNGFGSRWLDVGTASIAPNTGTLRIIQPLDFSRTPQSSLDNFAGLGDAPALVYSSDTVAVRPIAEVTPRFDPRLGLPDATIRLDFTFNGMGPYTSMFSTAGHGRGDTYLLAAQVPASTQIKQTNRYAWTATVSVHFSNPDPGIPAQTVTYPYSGFAQVVVTDNPDTPLTRDNSAFGPGWSLAGLDRLALLPTGVLLVYGSGVASHYFALNQDGSYTGPADDFGTLTKMGSGMNTTYTYTSKDQVKWNFDNTGLLQNIRDPHNLAVTFTYDGTGRQVTSIQMPDGGTTTFNYSGDYLSSIAEPGGRNVTIQRNGTDLASILNPDNTARTFTYDGPHHLIREQWDPVDVAYAYDTGGTGLLKSVDRGQGVTLTLDPSNVQGLQLSPARSAEAAATLTDGLGHATTYVLDTLGRITRMQRPGLPAETWKRDRSGQVEVHTDPKGQATSFFYLYGSGKGDLGGVSYPDGGSESFQYEPMFHKVAQYTDPLGHATQYTYNDTGDVLTKTDALMQVTTYSWTGGLLQFINDPRGNTLTYDFDPATRRLQDEKDQLNDTTTYLYDPAGNVINVQDPLGHPTARTFDGMRRVLTQTNADGGVLVYTYNAIGEVTTRTEHPIDTDHTTIYQYDSHGWQTKVTDAATNVSTSVYDLAGNVTKTIDANVHTTTYDYDAANRRTRTRDALMNATTMVYDANDNVTAVIDPRMKTTTYGYDALNRQTLVKDADMHSTLTAYDKAGNVTAVTDDANKMTRYEYDKINQRTKITDPLTKVTSLSYDAAGNVTHVQYPNMTEEFYDYDKANRRTHIQQGCTVSSTITYDLASNVISVATQVTDTLSDVTTYMYDAVNRRTLVQDNDTSTTTKFDKVGNVTAMVDGDGKETQ
jgi:YD repeat-containing protein